MKILYIWIVLLVVVGMSISYYLIPSKRDLALLKLKSKQYLDAKSYFEDQYNQGNRSLNIIVPLEETEVELGNISIAISVIEEYVKSHPKDIHALEMLSELYLINQQTEKYHQTLLEISKHRTDSKVLSELAYWYKERGKSSPFCKFMERLVATSKASSENFADLALCYAQANEYEKALFVMELRKKQFPKNITINDMLFEVWMAHAIASKGHRNDVIVKEKIRQLSDYLLEKKDPMVAYYAIQVVHERYPEFDPYLERLTSSLIQMYPLLKAETLEIAWENPSEKKRILEELLDIYHRHALNKRLQNLLFVALLDKKEDLLLSELIRNEHSENIDERNIVNLAYYATTAKKPSLAKEMQKSLGADYLRSHPIVAISLSAAAGKENVKEQIEKLLHAPFLSQTDLYLLLKIAAVNKYKDQVLAIGSRLRPFVSLSEYELVDVAVAYTEIKHALELQKMLLQDLPQVGIKNMQAALLVLDVSFGHSKKVVSWLSQQKNIKEYLLNGLYTASEVNHEYPLALYISKRLVKEYPSLSSEVYYASSLVQVGKVERGLFLLRNLYSKNSLDEFVQRSYFDALVFAAKRNSIYYADLKDFMQGVQRSSNNMTAFVSDFAYTYLDVLHDYQMSVELLQSIAENQPPESDDVQTLIYLWGPVGTQQRENWLVQRAAKSTDNEFSYWLQNLAYIGSFDKVIQLFRRRPVFNKRALFAYLDALSYKKQLMPCLKGELKRAVDRSFFVVHAKKDWEQLAVYAETAEYFEAKAKILEKIVSHTPTPKLWQELAKTYFVIGNYTKTACALMHSPRNAETLYERAVVLEKRRKFECAEHTFFVALKASYRQGLKKPQDYLQRALIFDSIGERYWPIDAKYQYASLKYMNQYYEITSRDADSQADYAQILMNDGWLFVADNLINQKGPVNK